MESYAVGGPHTCLNMNITPDHDKHDSDLIATCVVGMILTILFYSCFFIIDLVYVDN